MKLTHFLTGGLLLVMVVVTAAPSLAAAQTLSYQPRTQSEMVAYLYGRIAQLLAIQALIEKGRTLPQAADESSIDLVTISTHRATEVTETTAVLRGEVNLYGSATAEAWFEYGQDDDFLDQRTGRVSVRSAYERAVRVQVGNLEEDEHYYFRIATINRDSSVSYGSVFSFRTDEVDDDE